MPTPAGTAVYKVPSDYFTLAALPDTQVYSEKRPEIFLSQTKWIAENAERFRIKMTTHLGDIVENGNSAMEWEAAKAAYQVFETRAIPYAILPGNHDDDTTAERYSFYSGVFPISNFLLRPWWGDSMNIQNTNNYVLFEGGGEKYTLISLQYRPSAQVMMWADGVAKKFPERKVIVSTHGYLNLLAERAYGSLSFQYIWDTLLAPNPNVMMILSGHVAGEASRVDNPGGHFVYQLLSDYQARANGGNGLFRRMTFAPSQRRIYVQTYSTWLVAANCASTVAKNTIYRADGCYETDANSEFILNLETGAIESGPFELVYP